MIEDYRVLSGLFKHQDILALFLFIRYIVYLMFFLFIIGFIGRTCGICGSIFSFISCAACNIVCVSFGSICGAIYRIIRSSGA